MLDEGHNIKNYNTKVSRAAGQLDCLRRWVVPGTVCTVQYCAVLYCTVLCCTAGG